MAVVRWDPFRDLMSNQKDKYVVNVELAGVAADSVDVSVEDSTLVIQGERAFYQDIPEEAFHRVERRYGPFARSVSLPQTANPEQIAASFDKGVLTIEVPKVEHATPRKISIKASQ
ncbi:MAG: Hsp20/alpha crystallin family protein [Actinomycetota bacterium]